MKELIYLKQDLTKLQSDVSILIAHGVNCQRVMGSGVAKALYEKWPRVKAAYLNIPKDEMRLGLSQIHLVAENIFVANCWTQEYYGRDKKVYASKIHILQCIADVIAFCGEEGIENIYLPKIGCGLGGLDWEAEAGVRFFMEGLQCYAENVQIHICEL